MSHKKGTDRNQCILPLTIEEYVEAENPVRLIDEFVNGTNLKNNRDGDTRDGMRRARLSRQSQWGHFGQFSYC